MDFGLREWLLMLGPVFIIVVLVHGYLRMRAGRNTLKMALDKDFISQRGDPGPEDDISMFKGELPNGGARVRKIPEQGALSLEEDVPVLMEPVEMGRESDELEDAIEDEPITATDPENFPGDIPPGPAAPVAKPEHFVVFYVAALGEQFDGQALLESLVELDMQFGDMDIFHRLDSNGEPMFSLVNAVEPGTFDLATMGELKTPAVSLFMRAHEVNEPVEAFDAMVVMARSLAQELGGEVKDASRSVLTPQTIEHSREQVSAYQHRYC